MELAVNNIRYREEVIDAVSKSMELDEFDDSLQNADLFEKEFSGDILVEFFKRNTRGVPVLDIGCGSGTIADLIPDITHAVEPNEKRLERAKKKIPEVVLGWAERLPFEKNMFLTVICWRAFCYMRSVPEALYEINRVLMKGGRFIFDVVLNTNIPIAQTVHLDSFTRYVQLFGFKLIERREFVDKNVMVETRAALCVEKIDNYDARRFLMPQCAGKINNYLENRDWFMK